MTISFDVLNIITSAPERSRQKTLGKSTDMWIVQTIFSLFPFFCNKPFQRSVDFRMIVWCLQFSNKSTKKNWWTSAQKSEKGLIKKYQYVSTLMTLLKFRYCEKAKICFKLPPFFRNWLVVSKQSETFFSNFCGFLRISRLYSSMSLVCIVRRVFKKMPLGIFYLCRIMP